MSVEEEVIAKKLKEYSGMEEADIGPHTGDGSYGILHAKEGGHDKDKGLFASRIRENLPVLKNNEVNTSARYIKMEKGVRGKLNWLKKKVVRRLCFFYVQPVCDQQTIYNTAATQCIEKLLEAESGLCDKVAELQAENQSMKNELKKLLEMGDGLRDEIAELQEQKQLLEDELQKHDAVIQKELAEINTKLGQYLDGMEVIEKAGICKLPSAAAPGFIRSYAQAGEDAIILYLLPHLRMDLQKATYLDLGANHAKELSNTYALYEKGMRGVLLEANPALIPELKLNRSEDIIVNKCLASQSGQPVTFYVLSGDGLSTADREAVEKVIAKNPEIEILDEVEVETVTIQELLNKYFNGAPTLLNIDVEGMELSILNNIDFGEVRPKVVIVEMIEYSTMINAGNKDRYILEFMKEKNYIEYAFTGINSIFVDASVWDI